MELSRNDHRSAKALTPDAFPPLRGYHAVDWAPVVVTFLLRLQPAEGMMLVMSGAQILRTARDRLRKLGAAAARAWRAEASRPLGPS